MRLNLFSVVLGIATGFLIAALVAVLIWGIGLGFGGADPIGAIVVGALFGAIAAGFASGRTSPAPLFNGATAGVLFTGSITVLSVLDGSPAPTSTIILFVVGGLLLGSVGGLLAHRRALKAS